MTQQETLDRIHTTIKEPVELEQFDTDPNMIVIRSSVYTPNFQAIVKEFGVSCFFSSSRGLVVYD